MPNDFHFDVFLSHSAKDKPLVRPLAERLHAKAEVRRKKEELEFQPLAFSLQPFSTGSLAQFLYIVWLRENFESKAPI